MKTPRLDESDEDGNQVSQRIKMIMICLRRLMAKLYPL